MNKYLSLLLILLCLTACRHSEAPSDATGIFEATEVTLSARQAGELLSFDAEEGRLFTAGAVVGTIDSTLLTLQRRQLLANLNATDARCLDIDRQVGALRRQWENLRHERTRFAALVAEKAAPHKQLDDIEQQMAVVEQQMAAQQNQLTAANQSISAQSKAIVEQIAQLNHQIGNCRITVPLTGTVLTSFVEKGEYTQPGRPLCILADLRTLYLRAYVDAPLLTRLRIGQSATVYADQGEEGSKAYPGTLVWIADKAEFTPRTIQTRDERSNLVYAVKIRVRNDGSIKRGMYGEVHFDTSTPQRK